MTHSSEAQRDWQREDAAGAAAMPEPTPAELAAVDALLGEDAREAALEDIYRETLADAEREQAQAAGETGEKEH